MVELASIHDEETEKTTRDVVNGSDFSEDANHDFAQYLENASDIKFNYTEEDAEFVEQRVLLREKLQYPEMGTDYEPYSFENRHLSEKFRVGRHEDEFAEVALKLKEK